MHSNSPADEQRSRLCWLWRILIKRLGGQNEVCITDPKAEQGFRACCCTWWAGEPTKWRRKTPRATRRGIPKDRFSVSECCTIHGHATPWNSRGRSKWRGNDWASTSKFPMSSSEHWQILGAITANLIRCVNSVIERCTLSIKNIIFW